MAWSFRRADDMVLARWKGLLLDTSTGYFFFLLLLLLLVEAAEAGVSRAEV